jgi:hypothetical protein
MYIFNCIIRGGGWLNPLFHSNIISIWWKSGAKWQIVGVQHFLAYFLGFFLS